MLLYKSLQIVVYADDKVILVRKTEVKINIMTQTIGKLPIRQNAKVNDSNFGEVDRFVYLAQFSQKTTTK